MHELFNHLILKAIVSTFGGTAFWFIIHSVANMLPFKLKLLLAIGLGIIIYLIATGVLAIGF